VARVHRVEQVEVHRVVAAEQVVASVAEDSDDIAGDKI